jgi:hypothetical protein
MSKWDTRMKIQEAEKFEEEALSMNREPEKRGVYGIAAVTRILQGVDFPSDKRTLLENIKGREQFTWTKGQNLDLGAIIERLPNERFKSVTDLTQAVSERMTQEVKA